MEKEVVPMHQLPVGSFGRVREITASENTRRRMLDLGLISDTMVETLCKSPSGDPIAYQIRGAVIAFRSEAAANVLVELI